MQDLLTPKEVQATLRCSLAYVYKLVDRGHLPCVSFPHMGAGTKKSRSLIRFKRTDVAKFIEEFYTST